MRTCPKCGCYIPDKWITCPACNNKFTVSSKQKNYKTNIYKVNVLYPYNHLSCEYFGQYENAVEYAKRKVKEYGVYATQVVHNKIIIKQFEKIS